MLTTNQVKNALRSFAAAVNASVPDINCGGCCVVAAIVGEWLEQAGLVCDVVSPLRDPWRGGYDELLPAPAKIRPNINDQNNTEEWDKNGLSRAHLAVRFVSPAGVPVIWDTEGFYHKNTFGIHRHIAPAFGEGLTVEEARALADDDKPGAWNPTFNRANIPTLEALAEKCFAPLVAMSTQSAGARGNSHDQNHPCGVHQ